jgi:hypothetical protein
MRTVLLEKSEDQIGPWIIATSEMGPDIVVCTIFKFMDFHIPMLSLYESIMHFLILFLAVRRVVLSIE